MLGYSKALSDGIVGDEAKKAEYLETIHRKAAKLTTVSIFMDKSGKTVIADTGSPIPPEVSSQLFKPFVLGDESRTSRGGSDLELALAHKIMEKHEGKLTFVSNYLYRFGQQEWARHTYRFFLHNRTSLLDCFLQFHLRPVCWPYRRDK